MQPHTWPHPTRLAVDKLQREADGLKARAQALLHRMRYMAGRVREAAQLQPATRPPARAAQVRQEQALHPAPPPEQQQQPAAAGDAGAGASSAAAPEAADGAGASGSGGAGAAADAAGDAAAGAVAGAAEEQQAGMECPVCLAAVPAGADINVFSACGHAFCRDCAAKLVLQQGCCAVCRTKVRGARLGRPSRYQGAVQGAWSGWQRSTHTAAHLPPCPRRSPPSRCSAWRRGARAAPAAPATPSLRRWARWGLCGGGARGPQRSSAQSHASRPCACGCLGSCVPPFPLARQVTRPPIRPPSPAPTRGRSSRRASGRPRWRACCAACCTCRPPRPPRRRSSSPSSPTPSGWWPWRCRPTVRRAAAAGKGDRPGGLGSRMYGCRRACRKRAAVGSLVAVARVTALLPALLRPRRDQVCPAGRGRAAGGACCMACGGMLQTASMRSAALAGPPHVPPLAAAPNQPPAPPRTRPPAAARPRRGARCSRSARTTRCGCFC